MRKEHAIGPVGQRTVFCQNDSRVCLSRLCGVRCAGDDEDVAPMFQAVVVVSTSLGQCEGEELQAIEMFLEDNAARLVWQMAEGALELESTWSFCQETGFQVTGFQETGVVRRKDRLTNKSDRSVRVFRCQSRFVLPPGSWEVYSQKSQWCNENQGQWQNLHAGSLKFGCLPGRTTEGGTPYCCLRRVGAAEGLAFHVLPLGNWSIEVRARAVQDGLPYALVSLGMADDDLRLELSPGESLELPEILIQPLPSGEPHLAAPALHQYVQEQFLSSARAELPVVYNTWFDQFEVLEPPRLREQLGAAKQIGCEVFVVDAGWYGPLADDWWMQAGDWRERTTAAFRGHMKEFADEVRAAGLGFGLWMEPERFGPDVPIVKEDPRWFLHADAEFSRIDLANPAAYAYLRDEISRLVESYELAWMKVDFNFRLGPDTSGSDPSGGELSGYYEAWYRLLDEIRQKYPHTIFEGCASGAMRLDLNTLPHFDGHFLSDTVDPVDVLRIWQGALLRLPPGQLIKWAVLRSIGQTIPTYTKSLADSPPAMIAPCGAIWEPAKTVDLDFAVAAALPGIFGLGGDLAGMPPDARQQLSRHVAFFKQWREFMRGSQAHLLTPPKPKQDRQGWAAVQLTNPRGDASLLFAYRLDQSADSRRFVLRGLHADKEYRISSHIPSDRETYSRCGADLLRDGIRVELPTRYRAAIFVLEAR
ncbi:MAG: alpha-galactosidase [Planctomycetota bacterium]|nr:alpha-galactosidase [Planctomycetota bacterium]